MAELRRAETRLDVLKRDGVSAEQVRRALDDEEADLLDQAGRVSSDLSSSRATLRALGGSIRALSETLQDTRLNAHLQPLFSDWRRDIERLRFEAVAAKEGWLMQDTPARRRALSERRRLWGFLKKFVKAAAVVTSVVTVSVVLAPYVTAIAVAAVVRVVTVAVITFVGGLVCEVLGCDGEDGSLDLSVESTGLSDAWLGLARDSLGSDEGRRVVQHLRADHGVHRVARAVALAFAVYQLRPQQSDHSKAAIRERLLHQRHDQGQHGQESLDDISNAELYISDNSATGCPSAIAAYSPGDEIELGPSLYFAFEGTNPAPTKATCTKALSVAFMIKSSSKIDGVELNPGYADYVTGQWSQSDQLTITNMLAFLVGVHPLLDVAAIVAGHRSVISFDYESPFAFIKRVLDEYPGVTFRHITLTGHSLGGALALTAGVRLRQHLRENTGVAHAFHVVSFGSPRVVGKDSVDDMATFPHTRVTFGEDPITARSQRATSIRRTLSILSLAMMVTLQACPVCALT